MLMGKVVGTVVSTQKDEGLMGFKLLIVQSVGLDMKLLSSYVVAADAVGAGMGELVIVVRGSSARMCQQTLQKPVDAAIIAIVDSLEYQGKIIYRKFSEQAVSKT
ncbi:EutN/CcmL family microcompartment protein [Candidatus Sumerlaeota bacterium]|nr:EutN/CcmL family microcompartment protein [Candidatus Sumerlaeota bacterium]